MASPIPHSAGGGQGGADVLYVRLVSRILEGVPEGDALGVGRLPRPLVYPFLGCSEVGLCPEGVVFHVVGAVALGACLGLSLVCPPPVLVPRSLGVERLPHEDTGGAFEIPDPCLGLVGALFGLAQIVQEHVALGLGSVGAGVGFDALSLGVAG